MEPLVETDVLMAIFISISDNQHMEDETKPIFHWSETVCSRQNRMEHGNIRRITCNSVAPVTRNSMYRHEINLFFLCEGKENKSNLQQHCHRRAFYLVKSFPSK